MTSGARWRPARTDVCGSSFPAIWSAIGAIRQATAETIVDGWLDTGDVMSADADGYLWFHGRKKQIIVHDGSNICPQEVEGALLEHDAVASAGVVGVNSAMHGENVRAYVTLEAGATPPTMQDLIRFARARVGYKAPEEIIVLDDDAAECDGEGGSRDPEKDGGRRRGHRWRRETLTAR